jgi:uncharacterized protein YmfQ (DUF2313 family)
MATGSKLSAYVKALRKLLPIGRAWDQVRDDLIGLLAGLAIEFCRVGDRAKELLDEFDPGTSTDLLDDWETLLGLPDDCTPAAVDLNERRTQARQKLAATGGLSATFYEEKAAALGFDAIVTDFYSFRVGRQRVGEPLSNPFDPDVDVFRVGRDRVGQQLVVHGWRYCFNVNVEASVVDAFRVGENRVGDALVEFGNEILECTMAKLKPAHTCVFFTFRP